MMEVIAVLLMMAILTSMAVISMSGSNAEVVGQAEMIKAHLRFAQSRSMNTDNRFWGIQFDSGSNTYWLFSCQTNNSACNVGDITTRSALAGVELDAQQRMTLIQNVTLSSQTTILFDNFGTPYAWSGSIPTLYLQTPLRNDPDARLLGTNLSITLQDHNGNTASATITPETGYVL